MGEATARARPKNSLLEEDLDFERSGGARSAPAVTEEATKSLEDKIKARILEVCLPLSRFRPDQHCVYERG
jgi:U3 small nucleolar RNA-associated protein MPP10